MNATLNSYVEARSTSSGRAGFMTRVYLWMIAGIFLTAVVAAFLSQNPGVMLSLFRYRALFFGLLIIQAAMVFWMRATMERMSNTLATVLFFGHAALNGLNLALVLMLFTRESIAGPFFTAAAGFAGLSLLGLTIKRDLGPSATFFVMAVFGLLGWNFLSDVFPVMMAGEMGQTYSIFGALTLAAFTAYDIQKIKFLALHVGALDETGKEQREYAIHGALTLYLDFLSLSLLVVQAMGRGRRRK